MVPVASDGVGSAGTRSSVGGAGHYAGDGKSVTVSSY